jgi:hypothetical protein
MIARWKSRMELLGVSASLRPAPAPGASLGSWWSAVVVRWVLEWTPQLLTAGFPKQGRTAALFIRDLDDLRCCLLRYRKIHVICDNARIHDCQSVQR